MKKIVRLCFLICCASLAAAAQNAPFENFDRAVKAERAGFSGNKENLSKVFNRERVRLGGDFETGLWKYLGDDVEKHYRLSLFVEGIQAQFKNRRINRRNE